MHKTSGCGSWGWSVGSGFFLLWQGTSKCQILILQIYQEAPPQLSQLNRQDFAGIFHAFKAEIQNDDRSISLIVNNPPYAVYTEVPSQQPSDRFFK